MAKEHSHDHDHGNDHDHSHDHDREPARTAVAATAPTPPPDDAPMIEDAGSRALSEALSSSFAIVKVILVLLTVIFLGSGIFTVEPQEKAIKLRFGKPVGSGEKALLNPGLQWAFPYPIDEIVKIPVGKIHTVDSTVGWYAVRPEQELAGNEPPPGNSLNPANDGFTLTADGNIIHVRATVGYRINDPEAHVFNFTAVSNLVQNALNNALFYATARFPVDRALRLDVTGFKEKIESRTRELVIKQGLGVSIESLTLKTAPPRQVKQAFDQVIAAEQELSKAINGARGYANEVSSKANGESNAVVNAGLAERSRLLQTVTADAQSFTNQLASFEKDRNLFTQRRLTESLERVMTNASEKWFMPERKDGQPRELRLQMNPEPRKPTIKAPGQN